jgi:hypothetical protein
VAAGDSSRKFYHEIEENRHSAKGETETGCCNVDVDRSHQIHAHPASASSPFPFVCFSQVSLAYYPHDIAPTASFLFLYPPSSSLLTINYLMFQAKYFFFSPHDASAVLECEQTVG